MLSFAARTAPVMAILAALAGLAGGCSRLPRPRTEAAAVRPTPAPRASIDCRAPGWEHAAGVNASSLKALYWEPFGRQEVGWRIYAPLIGHEIGADCPPEAPAFARALAGWQKRKGYAPDGLVSQLTFVRMKGVLQGRRPIVLLSTQGICAAPADLASLAPLRADESLGDKPIELRKGALSAYRRMVLAARAEEPALAADPDLLKVFSGYRSPDYDAARCAAQDNCNGRERASCSPHRTGLATDLYLGHAPGYAADSSADPNRLFLTEGPAYRWMLANAGRFGFVNYPFEPWHWEWTGEAPSRGPLSVAGSPLRSGRSAGP